MAQNDIVWQIMIIVSFGVYFSNKMLNSKIFFIMLKIIIWLIRSNCWGGGGSW